MQLTALVHIVQLGNRFATFQLRGLEFKGRRGRLQGASLGQNSRSFLDVVVAVSRDILPGAGARGAQRRPGDAVQQLSVESAVQAEPPLPAAQDRVVYVRA